ncbi:hypothetical protein Cantr_05076 [Candida viswanathii]|uniref:F-box domain-containing protein n=1 Tax=Candida viswanathii TaxID=5486 RepID=A0A367XS01_9ASCO|nr:hypothetical protein Cantr_05076 [Candida viswanathii]
MFQISDSPREIIEVILGYVPNEVLVTLLDIPPVHSIASRWLYSTIRIGGSFFDVRFEDEDEEEIPAESSSVQPTTLISDDPFTALLILHSIPELLENTRCELTFDPEGNYSLFVDVYRRTPFPVFALVDFDIAEAKPELGLFKEVAHFTTNSRCGFRLDVRSLAPTWFPDLKKILTKQVLSREEISILPKQLTHLSCSLSLDEITNDSALKLDFPDKLKQLEISISKNDSSNLNIDISHLHRLHNLTINGAARYASRGDNIIWSLPLLKKLTYDSSLSLARELNRMCPELVELCVVQTNSDCRVPSGFVNNLPCSVTTLLTPPAFLGNDASKDCDFPIGEDMSEIGSPIHIRQILPTQLRSLRVAQESPYGVGGVLEFNQYNLPNLNTFSIANSPDLKIYGSIPINVTELTFYESGGHYLHNLESLFHLKSRAIQGILDTKEFS